MNTQTKGDILADKITNAMARYSPIDARVKSALERALAEYHASDPYAELKKAHAEGKTIQHLDEDVWVDWGVPLWNYPPERYRVKPATVMVPLSAEDVPPGSAIRYRFAVDSEGVHVQTPRGCDRVEYSRAQYEMEISRDGGKTWHKCSKESTPQ